MAIIGRKSKFALGFMSIAVGGYYGFHGYLLLVAAFNPAVALAIFSIGAILLIALASYSYKALVYDSLENQKARLDKQLAKADERLGKAELQSIKHSPLTKNIKDAGKEIAKATKQTESHVYTNKGARLERLMNRISAAADKIAALEATRKALSPTSTKGKAKIAELDATINVLKQQFKTDMGLYKDALQEVSNNVNDNLETKIFAFADNRKGRAEVGIGILDTANRQLETFTNKHGISLRDTEELKTKQEALEQRQEVHAQWQADCAVYAEARGGWDHLTPAEQQNYTNRCTAHNSAVALAQKEIDTLEKKVATPEAGSLKAMVADVFSPDSLDAGKKEVVDFTARKDNIQNFAGSRGIHLKASKPIAAFVGI